MNRPIDTSHPPTPPHSPYPSTEPILEARGLCMRFGSVTALDGVDFTLRPGEIHALMGENGAGKSTLIKCLTGVHTPQSGHIRLAGRTVRPASPRDAESAGVACVYQEVGLIPHATIAENICLGREPVRRSWPRLIRWREVRARARAAMGRLGLTGLDVTRELSTCSVAIQQLVAIARALDIEAHVLILDEPTSSLDRDECIHLFAVLRRLRDQGLGIVFITHFLDQVDAIADRVTILRDGRLVGVHDARSLPRATLVSLMVGREFEAREHTHATPSGMGGRAPENALLDARGIGRRGRLKSVDLSISRGEAVGLAGLLGSGRTETARLLFGVESPDCGELLLAGRPMRFRSPRAAIAKGLALTPENRKTEGIVPSLSVAENMLLAIQARRGLSSRLSRTERHRLVAGFVSALGIKTPHAQTPIASLSGGNQQKVLLARWLVIGPALLILDEPTRGIDVGAKADVLGAIERLRRDGMAVLLISSELEEVVRTCERVVVLRDRRSIAELSGPDLTEQNVLRAIAQHHV